MYKYLKQEITAAQFEHNNLSDVAESFLPPESSPGTTRRKRSIEKYERDNRTRRLIGAVVALNAGAVLILEERINDAAYNALSILFLCGSTEDLERELDQVTKQQKTQQQAFQTIRSQNNEKLAQLRDEICLTQESVERIKEDTYSQFLKGLKVYTLLKMLFDAIKSKVPIAIFCNLCNFTSHKSEHCTHTLKPFNPLFTLVEITFSRSFHLLPRDTLLQKPRSPHNLLQSC